MYSFNQPLQKARRMGDLLQDFNGGAFTARPRPQAQPAVAAPAGTTNTGADLQPDGPSPYPAIQPGKGQGGGFDVAAFAPKGMSARNAQRRLMAQNYALFLNALQPYANAQNQLITRANTDHFSPEERSAFLAPRLEQLDTSYDLQEGALDRNLARRGLDSSSAAVSEFANLGAHRAADRAGIVNGLFSAEEARQQQAQAALLDLLMAQMGRSSNQAGNMANALRQMNLTEQQMKAQQGGFLDQLMGFAGTAAQFAPFL